MCNTITFHHNNKLYFSIYASLSIQ